MLFQRNIFHCYLIMLCMNMQLYAQGHSVITNKIENFIKSNRVG